MGLNIWVVSDKGKLDPVSPATETSQKIEISPMASLDIMHSKKQIIKALFSLHGCAGWSAPLLLTNPEDSFARAKAYMIYKESLSGICSDPIVLFNLMNN